MSLLLDVIQNEDTLSEKQKKILIAIYNFSVPVSSRCIAKALGIKDRQNVHQTLLILLERNFIIREKIRVFLYSVNQDKMKEMVENYKQIKFYT